MRKIMVALLCVAVLFSTITYYPRKAEAAVPPVIIGQLAVKGVERALATSIVRAAGVKGSKKAIERAQEAWFSRLTAQELAALQNAAANATPYANWPGWLKATFSVVAFITGVDMLYDLYQMFKAGEPVEYNTLTYEEEDETIKGFDENLYGYISIWGVPEVTVSGNPVVRVYGNYFDGGEIRTDYLYIHWFSTDFRYVGLQFRDELVIDGRKYFEFKHVYQVYVESRGEWDTFITNVTVRIPENGALLVESSLEQTEIEWEPAYPVEIPQYEVVEIYFPDPDAYPDPALAPAPVILPPGVAPGELPGTYPPGVEFPDPQTQPVPQPNPGQQPQPEPEPEPEPSPEPSPQPPTWPEPGPSPEGLDWEKLRIAGDMLTTKFPFSLPFDLYRLVQELAGPQTVPHITLDFPVYGIGTYRIYDGPIVPEGLQKYVPWVRTGMLIVFTIALIMATRRLMGGGT